MPKFQKGFPKNALDHFDPASDEAFRRQHPIGYGILVAFGIGGLVLPLILLILVTEVWFPAPNSGFLFLAMIGCFIMGIGFFNIAAAWIGQYLGHWLTVGSFLFGGTLVAISLMIIYVPDIYAFFDETAVSYYFASMLFLALPPIYYASFRLAVDSWLRRKKISKSRMKKLKKGKQNYWWYKALHEEVGLGMIYPLNKLFTILYPIELCLSLLLGWIRSFAPVISFLYAIISLLLAGMTLFSSVQHNIDEYGAPIVILRRTKRNGFDSSILDLAMAAFPLGAAYAHILMMLDIFGISR